MDKSWWVMKHHPRCQQQGGTNRRSARFRVHFAFTLRGLRLILAAFRPSPPLYFRQPLRRSTPSFSLSDGQAFQHDDRFRYLIALRAKIRQHFVNVHFSSVPESGVAVTNLFSGLFDVWAACSHQSRTRTARITDDWNTIETSEMK